MDLPTPQLVLFISIMLLIGTAAVALSWLYPLVLCPAIISTIILVLIFRFAPPDYPYIFASGIQDPP